jgi:hypothetical protein
MRYSTRVQDLRTRGRVLGKGGEDVKLKDKGKIKKSY